MPPRKKDAPSSSSTSSSNSSSSSTSSSSSSGSDSSSSDSENSSTSAGGKSGQPSSDSDKKPTPKKKTASATVTRSKSDASEPDKSKEKPSKSKASTTTTSNKPTATSNTAHASCSSDSEEDTPKVNSKRKPPAKPKSSATVTPVTKGQNKTTARGNSNTSSVKKVNPPRKAAQKSASNTGSSSGLTSKESSSSKATLGPKLDDPKKLKTKSIFSPDNTSDDSDDKATPPPPKLTAIKTSAASKSSHNKTKTKPSPQTKSRASSVSSNSSDSSRSSRSSSDSSPDSSRTKTDNSSSAANRKASQLKKEKKSAAPPKLESDTDTPIVRKQTRSSSTRKSKHVISRIGSDSDSDTGTRTSASKSPAKKVGPKGPPSLRKPKSGPGEYNQHIEFEERSSCPLAGCDSIGHLSGKYDKHYILEACPRYHNMTPQQCKDALVERTKREEERKKAQLLVKGQVLVPTAEQRMYREKVKEMRSKHATRDDISVGDSECKDRQPDLGRWSNKYDLKLFQEAQAVASEAIEEELRQLANVNCTKYIEMGKFEMEVWYQSPYPEDFARLPKLYICEYCLRYMKSRTTLERHAAKCVWRHPPGEEVYRKEKISVWEVDGKRYKSYCQNLCLLAKFFLDHKTLYYDVEPFLFYVMTISDSEGCHIVGYFSKEKNSFLNYNVSCILTLPPYQRQGYGRLLIEFSYLLTRVENKIGSPEKPLSDLGLISYRSYWKDVLLEYLCNLGGKQISVKDISQEMAINSYDIVSTLQALGMMKYWKGKHIILKKQDVIDEYVDRSKRRGVSYKEIDPECLKWSPYVPPDTPPGPN